MNASLAFSQNYGPCHMTGAVFCIGAGWMRMSGHAYRKESGGPRLFESSPGNKAFRALPFPIKGNES
ncbi:hypothetical protein [Komagataeibacter sp. FXV3]|uniref:hypothetical protein n=1 Tax=Komagataeibacter sp. FXV3 TaxID=2608998 RepID=UPI00187B8FF6|nr:hypothetical protein [Komagataeibacter sp. FXV3]MBE7729748.1 hypothetical protein [Komagataeibacter sp. FXV3]